MTLPKETPFAWVPLELVLDHRLTAMQYRILLTLLTFRNRNTGLLCPKRETIAERCGYSVNSISRATSQLVELGWLKKKGSGGRSSPTHYEFTVPETLSDPETVADPATVAEQDTKTLSDPDTKTLVDPDRGKEQTREQTKEQRGSRPASSLTKRQKTNLIAEIELPPEIPQEKWREFVWDRYERGKHMTDIAASKAIKELQRLSAEGNSAGAVLDQSIMNGWTSIYPVKQNGKGYNGHQGGEDPWDGCINRDRWEGPQ